MFNVHEWEVDSFPFPFPTRLVEFTFTKSLFQNYSMENELEFIYDPISAMLEN